MRRPKADREFHLQAEFPVGPDPRGMYDLGVVPFWDRYGGELFVDVVTKLRKHPKMRAQVLGDLRRAWWQLRYHRKAAVQSESGRDAIRLVIESYELLWWAGYRDFDLKMLTNCLSSACTCDGCDLADGQRFSKQPPDDWIGNPATAQGHGGGSAP